METAARNPDSPNPLPLFRPEALAARQSFHGEVLSIRPFSWRFLCWLGALIVAIALIYLLAGHYTPTAKVAGKISSGAALETAPDRQPLKATFYIAENKAFRIQPGARVPLRCSGCTQPFSLGGIVTGIKTIPPSTEAASTNLARPGPVREVTVALSPVKPPPASSKQLTPGATLEAEFPLARRPLIRWLIGPAGL
jgi:hypothetical protein